MRVGSDFANGSKFLLRKPKQMVKRVDSRRSRATAMTAGKRRACVSSTIMVTQIVLRNFEIRAIGDSGDVTRE